MDLGVKMSFEVYEPIKCDSMPFVDLFKKMQKNKGPTFHEIRALAAFLKNDMGNSPQERMANKNSEITKKYLTNHKPFITVKPSEVRFKKK